MRTSSAVVAVLLFCVQLRAGSITLTGRANDPSPVVGTGTNFCVENNNSPRASDFTLRACNSGLAQQGGQSSGISIQASGGIVMSSSAQGGPVAGFSYAGAGKVSVLAPSITVMNGSSSSVNPAWAWQATFAFPPDGPLFDDPMRGKGQPPITTTNLGNPAIPGVTAAGGLAGPITGSSISTNPLILPPANYWNQAQCAGAGCAFPVATGTPVTLSCNGDVDRSNKCYFSFQNPGKPGTFSDYIIYGGLRIDASSGYPVVNLGPGRYTFAGTLSNAAFASGVNPSLTVEAGATLQDATPIGAAAASNVGEALIFTDLNYPGLSVNIPAAVQNCACLSYGTSGVFIPDPANNSSSTTTVVLHGLNPNNGIPQELATFGSILLWQDQGNSLVKYTSSGFVDTTSCGAGFSLDNPCPNGLTHPNAAQMDFSVGANSGGPANFSVGLNGIAYSPRGAWDVMLSYGDQNGGANPPLNLDIISGSLAVDGKGTLILR